jgi:hypothetical protein
MAEQIAASSIGAPGFKGLNSQDSQIQLDAGFASQAYNCIIDKYGRIGARKGWSKVNATNTDLGTNSVQFIFEMVDPNGNQTLSGGNNKLFVGTTTLTEKKVRNQANSADLSYTISANHWQAAALPYGEGQDAYPHAYLAQAAHEALVYHNMPTPGTGATFTVSTVGGGGVITALTVTTAGSGYNVGDILTLAGGTGSGAVVTILTLSGTGVATVSITNAGTGYTATNVLTSTVTTIADPHSHVGSYGFQRIADVGSLPVGYTVSEFKPNCVLAAYGRIWYADIAGDRQTVYFSRLLNGSQFSGGDSGSLSLGEVFPANDKIVALAAHNGFLIIFGGNNIAIYRNPIDVTALELAEFIPNVGCITRDTVVSTGSDIIFLSAQGVRSLQRLVIEKSIPFRDLSKNVRDELMRKVESETSKIGIKAVYSPLDAFYLVSLPTVKEVYCFDLRTQLEDGAARVTVWNKIEPTALFTNEARQLLIGKKGYIGKYNTYLDDTATYRFQYFTTYFDLGQPTIQKILKRVAWTVISGSEQEIVTKWGFDYSESFRSITDTLAQAAVSEYNVAEYNIGEYSSGIVIARLTKQVGGAGLVLQIGIETEINQNPMSIQKVDVSAKIGKIV